MKSKQKVSSFIGITFPYLIKDSVNLNERNLYKNRMLCKATAILRFLLRIHFYAQKK